MVHYWSNTRWICTKKYFEIIILGILVFLIYIKDIFNIKSNRNLEIDENYKYREKIF